MRVLQVINTLAVSDGGPARSAYDMHLAMQQRGVPASLFVVRRDREAVVYPAALAVPSPGRPAAIVSSRSPFRLLLAVLRADAVIVHGYYLWWIPFVAVLVRITARRLLLTPHGSFTAYKLRRSSGRKRVFDRTAGVLLDRAIQGIGLGSLEEVADTRSKLPHPMVTVCGVGTTIPDLPAPAPTGSPLILLSVSRVAPGKRVDLMIMATGELRRRGTDVRLAVAGTGSPQLIAQLRELAEREGVAAEVEFIGQVEGESKSNLFREADVFLALSDDENFGISVAEALAHGVACVASEFIPAAAGLSGATGRVLTDRSAVEVADAVLSLAATPRAERFVSARAHASAAFGWEAVTDRWLALAAGRDASRPATAMRA